MWQSNGLIFDFTLYYTAALKSDYKKMKEDEGSTEYENSGNVA